MKHFLLAITIIFVIIISACTCSTCGKQSELPEIPELIKANAAKFISEKTGNEFFEKNIFPDLIHSTKKNNYYEMHYIFRMIDYDFVNEPIVLSIDSLGNIDFIRGFKGIPSCLENEENCVFNIDEEEAIEIAKQNNLSKGIRDWEISFRWHDKFNKYVWHIISTNREIGNIDSEMYKAEGEEIVINPNNGEIILQSEWKIN